MFPHLGFPEIIVLLGIGLLIFGPKKLPEFGKSIGEAFVNFKKSFQKSSDEQFKADQDDLKDKETI
ncbi:MAG: twin-arginine translocase TatA/TatE family subunit [Candidatus Caenarcaniphilales bacterium]|nr:twin-arginine translocase TatA/TatE family subunit [Candidatus Caenarcaniphilales bacterium]